MPQAEAIAPLELIVNRTFNAPRERVFRAWTEAAQLDQWFAPAPGSDGHFVVFDVPACRNQAAQFIANLAADPVGNVPPLP